MKVYVRTHGTASIIPKSVHNFKDNSNVIRHMCPAEALNPGYVTVENIQNNFYEKNDVTQSIVH